MTPEFQVSIGKVAGIVASCALFPYLYAILFKDMKPNRATWAIWCIVGIIMVASYHSSGASNTIWIPVAYAIGPCIVVLLSIKYGEGGWTTFDQICLLGAFSSMTMWWLFDSPVVALVMLIVLDFMGALPTIKKVYEDPASEDSLAWGISWLGNLLNLFAVEKMAFEIVVYPLYMFLTSGVINALILRSVKGEAGKESSD